MNIVDDLDQFFLTKRKYKKLLLDENYKGDLIKSDPRVHEMCEWIINNSLPKKQKKIKILDLAAGSGALIHRIIDSISSEIKLDITLNNFESQLTYVKENFNITYEDLNKVDKEYWVSKYGSFDIIIATEVIEHLDYGYNLFEIIKSTIAENGYAIVSSPNNNNALDRYMFLRYGHEHYFGERGFTNSCGHLQPYPKWLIKNYAQRVNLKLKFTYIPLVESFRPFILIKSIIPWLLSKSNYREGLNSTINIWLLYK